MSKLDIEVLKKLADKFTDYVHTRDNNSLPLNFIDGSGVLVSEEGYKEEIFDKAQDILKCYEWDESWIGTGNIKDRIFQVMDISSNLVNFNTQIDFKKHFVRNDNKLDPDTERIIYEIYKGNDDKHQLVRSIIRGEDSLMAYEFKVENIRRFLFWIH